uniref:Nudix hydrolase domain-containing protein n=1 Tax=Syphacia muris TaxID=451379 RepID=A0A0N5AK28_9BILA
MITAIFAAAIRSMPENAGKLCNEICWSKYPISIGMTIELCAGLIDKPNLSDARHMVEEIEEECGYSVKEFDLQFTGIGTSGALQSLYYAEIDESMKIGEGGGIDNEKIEKVFMSLNDAKEYLNKSEVMSAPGLLYGLSWFFDNVKKE